MAGERQSFGDDIRAPDCAAAPQLSYSIGAASDGEVSFGFLLRQSAHAIDRGHTLIAARGDTLARTAAAKGAVEAALASHAARLLIALFWVFIGVVLAREALAGSPVRGLSAESAALLARIFVAIGVLGAVAAFVGGFLTRSAARTAPSLEPNFGSEAGGIVRDFGDAVAALKSRIEGDGSDAAADDISRLHLVALEAASFLEGISFLTEPDHARAETEFRAFLSRRPAPPGSGPSPFFLLALGALTGAGAVFGGAPLNSGLPLWAIAALPGLAVLYAGMGFLFAAAGSSATASAAARARHDLLTDMRRAYVAAGPPRAGDLIAGVEAALSRFRRRIADEDRSRADHSAASDPSEFAWRRPPEAPRFVAQTFEAAPPVFRPDRQGGLRKNFFGGRSRNADPKQSPSAPDAPPSLKE